MFVFPFDRIVIGVRQVETTRNLVCKLAAYLLQGTEHFEDYVRAVHWAQHYALANRELMMRNLITVVQGSGEVPAFEANVEVVSCHRNHVTWEHHYGENVLITRNDRFALVFCRFWCSVGKTRLGQIPNRAIGAFRAAMVRSFMCSPTMCLR
jgi:RNA-splicing ligase RtcB